MLHIFHFLHNMFLNMKMCMTLYIPFYPCFSSFLASCMLFFYHIMSSESSDSYSLSSFMFNLLFPIFCRVYISQSSSSHGLYNLLSFWGNFIWNVHTCYVLHSSLLNLQRWNGKLDFSCKNNTFHNWGNQD